MLYILFVVFLVQQAQSSLQCSDVDTYCSVSTFDLLNSCLSLSSPNSYECVLTADITLTSDILTINEKVINGNYHTLDGQFTITSGSSLTVSSLVIITAMLGVADDAELILSSTTFSVPRSGQDIEKGRITVSPSGKAYLSATTMYSNLVSGNGIYNSGTLYLLGGNVFTATSAEGSYGSAIYNEGNIADYATGFVASGWNSFTGCKGTFGGAIYNKGNIELKNLNTAFYKNTAQYAGGAIYVAEDGEMSLRSVSFISNHQIESDTSIEYGGGAIYIAGGAGIVEIYDTSFITNAAASYGGAVMNVGASTTLGASITWASNTDGNYVCATDCIFEESDGMTMKLDEELYSLPFGKTMILFVFISVFVVGAVAINRAKRTKSEYKHIEADTHNVELQKMLFVSV